MKVIRKYLLDTFSQEKYILPEETKSYLEFQVDLILKDKILSIYRGQELSKIDPRLLKHKISNILEEFFCSNIENINISVLRGNINVQINFLIKNICNNSIKINWEYNERL